MKIVSPAFENQEKVPVKYTCNGENINPPLEFVDVPEGTKSLALIVDDPDAPNGTWVHWVVFNIPPTVKAIMEHSTPEGGIEADTSWGKPGYGGPCPPPASPEQLQRGESGTHRYFFKLYAVSDMLSFEHAEKMDKSTVEQEMEGKIIGQAELVGLYARPNN